MAREVYTRKKAIRMKCLDCCCGQSQEVKFCTAVNCALWPYRKGALTSMEDLSTHGFDLPKTPQKVGSDGVETDDSNDDENEPE